MFLWLLGMAAIFSVLALLWIPRHPMLETFKQSGAWFNFCYGFSLFDLSSTASDRMNQILGMVGMLNLLAGLFLVARNHLAGWLTIAPPLLLYAPFVSIPFANALVTSDTILTFHRMFYAIPSGLAIVFVASYWRSKWPEHAAYLLPLALIAALTMPPSGRSFNRLWNAVTVVPSDLDYSNFVTDYERLPQVSQDWRLCTAESAGFVLQSYNLAAPELTHRDNGSAPIRRMIQFLGLRTAVQDANNAPPALNQDPWARDRQAWVTLSGAPPIFISDLEDLPLGFSAIQNAHGASTEIFTSELISVEPAKVYQVEFTIRRKGPTEGKAYLAVAWYDRDGRFLDAGSPLPHGAGYPEGWRSGTYSYFGLINTPPPIRWRTYRISFGRGEIRQIPAHAAYVRIGVLLNYGQAPAAVIQVTNARLSRKTDSPPMSDGDFAPGDRFRVIAATYAYAFTPSSAAACLSRHWLPRQVAIEIAGGREFETQLGSQSGGSTPWVREFLLAPDYKRRPFTP